MVMKWFIFICTPGNAASTSFSSVAESSMGDKCRSILIIFSRCLRFWDTLFKISLKHCMRDSNSRLENPAIFVVHKWDHERSEPVPARSQTDDCEFVQCKADSNWRPENRALFVVHELNHQQSKPQSRSFPSVKAISSWWNALGPSRFPNIMTKILLYSLFPNIFECFRKYWGKKSWKNDEHFHAPKNWKFPNGQKLHFYWAL